MKKILLLTFLFAGVVSFVFAQPPFQSGGKLFTSFFAGSPNVWPYTSWLEDSLSSRFGDFPSYIIWDDVADTTDAYVQIYWDPPYTANPPAPWWGDSLKWKDLRPYVTGLFTSVETGDTLIRDLPVGTPDEVISLDSSGRYKKHVGFDCDLLPIPNDGSAWTMEVIPTIDIYDSVEVNPNREGQSLTSVVRMNPTTPLDSLLWFRDTWADHLENHQLHWEMLRHYPYFQPSLFVLFDHYYDEELCDSVSHYGNRYVESLVNNLDDFWEHTYPTPELGFDSVHVNRVKEMINDICVEGKAQREKYPPRELF